MPISNVYNVLRLAPTLTSTSTSTSKPSETKASASGSWMSTAQFILRAISRSERENLENRMAKEDPYYPVTSRIEGYVENDKTLPELLASFGGSCLIILATTWYALKTWRPNLSDPDRMVVLWFTLTGCLHTFFEGYFVYNHGRMPGRMDLLGQLWKEYALSDSRYLMTDTFVLSIEAITATIWGPLSFCTAFMIATSNPLRHSFQMIVSVAHIYGTLLYFATATVDSYWKDISYARPEHLYYWVYFVGMNMVFIVIPSALLLQSIGEARSAFAAFDRMRESVRANGKMAKAQRPSERKRSK